MAANKLTEKQKIFCKEYLIDFNGTRAAKAAGYSEKTAFVTANENLRKPYIQEYIKKQIDKRNEKTEITAARVVEELAKIGFIKKDDGIEGYSMEFDSKDKLKALEMLARHAGAFNEDKSGQTVINVEVNKPE